MLVDIDLDGCLVIIAGAGAEAHRRAKSLLRENCRIIVIGDRVDARLAELACDALEIRKTRLSDAEFVRGCGARIVIAATDDDSLNAEIADAAQDEPNCLVYVADDPSRSNYSHVAVHRLSKSVEMGISTLGRSPIMARALRDRAAESLSGMVAPSDEAMIELQSDLRSMARARISTQAERRSFLRVIAGDPKVTQLIKDGRTGAAKERAMAVLDGWCNA